MMKFGTMYKQGEIITIPFPFTDLTIVKQRPALIISKNQYNEKTEDIIVCGITSNLKNSEFSVLIDNKNLVEGKIPTKSRIKVDKIYTLRKNMIRNKIARVDQETFNKIKEEFHSLI